MFLVEIQDSYQLCSLQNYAALCSTNVALDKVVVILN
jgi:hypothetical protein